MVGDDLRDRREVVEVDAARVLAEDGFAVLLRVKPCPPPFGPQEK
jgi:hypothetical protein